MSLHNRGTAIVAIGRYPDGALWTATQMESALDRSVVSRLVLGDADAWRAARSPDDVSDAALGWASVSRFDEPRLWQRALVHATRELGARLWPAIETVVGVRARELILLPGAGFAVLPLHAALLRDGGRAQDRYTLRYAPSLKLLAAGAHHALPRRDIVLGQLVPAAHDLPFAEVEAARVAERLGAADTQRAAGADATPDRALALFESADVLHFAGHGAFDVAEPLRSRLLCAGDGGQADAPLTVRALLEHGQTLRCSLAILSACESGRVDAADLMNDALGLPGALLAAGCGGVIATFWPVVDITAALVLDETLAHWPARQPSLPAALADATRWLREANGSDIAARLAAWRDAHPSFSDLLSPVITALDTQPSTLPFADERHWAAFHVVGQPEPRRRGTAR